MTDIADYKSGGRGDPLHSGVRFACTELERGVSMQINYKSATGIVAALAIASVVAAAMRLFVRRGQLRGRWTYSCTRIDRGGAGRRFIRGCRRRRPSAPDGRPIKRKIWWTRRGCHYGRTPQR